MTAQLQAIALPPRASAMIEALRDIGYSLESAVADIIDNCLTASATRVDLLFGWTAGSPWLAVVDNGKGLSPKDLVEAMRPGSRDPLEERARDDLGRFGLGMKTASFSQCRRLTVVSKHLGCTSGWCWDLDEVRIHDEWRLLPVDPKHIGALPAMDLLTAGGTIVLWQKIDRLDLDADTDQARANLNSRMESVRRHLSLVFHRYLQGEFGRPAVEMSVNHTLIQPYDPFNAKNPATAHLLEERVTFGDESVTIQPYILPHHSKVPPTEYERLAGEEGYLRNQGFYVYRNRRLIKWGTWFRLAKQEELTKLARIRVDVPNTLDHLWTIDVRKSRANPPQAVRERMRQVVERIRQAAKKPYTHRGAVIANRQQAVQSVWLRRVFNDRITYEIDPTHPIVEDLRLDLDDQTRARLDMVLRLVSSAFPAPLFFSDMASEPRKTEPPAPDESMLLQLARIMRDACVAEGKTDLRQRLLAVEPFASWPQRTESVLAQIQGEER